MTEDWEKFLWDQWNKEDWLPWNDELWMRFHNAVKEIEALGHSRGVAERTLRQLCATGDIRSICHHWSDKSPRQPEPIGPSEWGELDLHGKTVDRLTWTEGKFVAKPMAYDLVRVSDADFRHWLKKQQPTEAKKQQPKKALGKRPRIKALLAKLFPNGVPDPAHWPRQELQGKLLKADPGLNPLDLKTLKAAIDEHNAALDRKRQELLGNPSGSD